MNTEILRNQLYEHLDSPDLLLAAYKLGCRDERAAAKLRNRPRAEDSHYVEDGSPCSDDRDISEKEFCEQWCGQLTHEQAVMVAYKVKQNQFLGVGRPVGGMQFMPLVLIGKTPNVIDKAGYYQLASMEGRRGYTPNPSDQAR